MAKALTEIKNKNNKYDIYYRFIGTTAYSTYSRQVFESIYREIESKLSNNENLPKVEFEIEELKEKVRTIGGHILFPAHKKNGFTINQARGISKKICDRFDLTLECIRRLYLNETSPLYDTLLNYEDFFKLFVDFKNYIDFFMLQDFVNEKYEIQFSIPFDNFLRSPLPQNINEYKQYKNHTIELMNKRNKRIAEYYKMYCT